MGLKDKWSTFEYFAFFGGCALAAAAILYIFPGYSVLWKLISEVGVSNWINLIAALGSMAAVGVALWLGLMATNRSHTEALSRAGLHAASVTAQLSHMASVVSACSAACTFTNLEVDSDTSNFQAIGHVARALQQNTFVPDTNTLLGLTPLGNNCANRIARAFDNLSHIRTRLAALDEYLYGNHVDHVGVRRREVQIWKEILQETDDLLAVALRDLISATNLAAPTPTGEERYGPGDE